MFDISTLSHCSIEDITAEHVFSMLMKNFQRVYHGEYDEEAEEFVRGNKAPWGLYMHAAWFFGQPEHFAGYKMFLDVSSPAVR